MTIWYKPASTIRSLLAVGVVMVWPVALRVARVFLAYRLSSGSVSEIPGCSLIPLVWSAVLPDCTSLPCWFVILAAGLAGNPTAVH